MVQSREAGEILAQSEAKSNKHSIYIVEENSAKVSWPEAKSWYQMAANEKDKRKLNKMHKLHMPNHGQKVHRSQTVLNMC